MQEIQKYVNGLKPGKVQSYRNMALVPLMGKDSKLDYLVFDEAINSGLHVSETGSVPTLHFANNTEKEVLIIQGEYVLGGKQNRMVSRNAYMAENFDGEVPVNCVQQHRWTSGAPRSFGTSHKRAPRSLCFAASIGQREVWSEVNYLHAGLGVRSSTENLDDAYDQKQSELSDYLNNFEYTPGAVGVVAVIQNQGKKVYAADIFDQGDTSEKYFNKMVESYALEAATGGGDIKKPTKKEIGGFLKSLKDCKFQEQKPISLGRDYIIRGSKVQGSALLYDGTNVYVTFSTKPERIPQGPRSGRRRRPGRIGPGRLDSPFGTGFSRHIF